MKVIEATSKNFFNYLFDTGAENSYQKKKREIYMNCLKNEIESILNLMNILMIIWIMMDWKTLLEMKEFRILLWMTSLVGIKCSEKLLHHSVLFYQVSSWQKNVAYCSHL